MKYQSFAQMREKYPRADISYDNTSNQLYMAVGYFVHWERGGVDLTTSFDGNTARTGFGGDRNISVVSSNELNTNDYALFTQCGVELKKADLNFDGQTMLCFDWDHKVAVKLQSDYLNLRADTGIRRTVRWPGPGALPVPAVPVTARVFDRKMAASHRKYTKELLGAVNLMRKMIGDQPFSYYGYMSQEACQAIDAAIEEQQRADEVMALAAKLASAKGHDPARHLRVLKYIESVYDAPRFTRRLVTSTYLNVVRKP